MTVTITQRTGTEGVIVRVVGDIDLASAPVVKARLAEAMREAVETALVLDLSDVRLIDDVGVGLLLGVRRSLRSTGAELSLVASNAVERALTAFDVYGLFSIVAPVD